VYRRDDDEEGKPEAQTSIAQQQRAPCVQLVPDSKHYLTGEVKERRDKMQRTSACGGFRAANKNSSQRFLDVLW
jgi:hypothetical protein